MILKKNPIGIKHNGWVFHKHILIETLSAQKENLTQVSLSSI